MISYICSRCERTVLLKSRRRAKSSMCQPCAASLNVPPNKTHGMRKHRLYIIWLGMRARCANPKSVRYSKYGERGISVCPEWQSSAAFIAWALGNGYADSLQIDRINNDGNYEPTNCRWVTRTQNARNAGFAKLRSHVPEIKARLASGEGVVSIARSLNVHRDSISKIKRGVAWA